VAGLDDQDETRSFDYQTITNVNATSNLASQWITFSVHTGTKYRFAETGTHAGDVTDAAEYINSKIDPHSSATNSSNRSNSDAPRFEQLSALFEDHLNRDDHGDHWINLTFENAGQTDTHYQYLNELHNLTNLTPEQKAVLTDVTDQYGLTIESQGDNYATVTSGSQDPEVEMNVCLNLLRDVYNTGIDDITQAAEHDDGYKAW
jgi:hypothetical protein